MDAGAKAKIAAIKQLLKKKQYSDALLDLEVLIYKHPKLYQAHLMAGLCYDKTGKENLAEKSYLEVLDIKQNQPNAIKALCQLYTKQQNGEKATQFMELHISILKKTEPIKYKEQVAKLVKLYEKNENMEKIDAIFKEYIQIEEKITDQFVSIASSYFRTGVTNQCFRLQEFQLMGIKGQQYRKIIPSARQPLNYLLIDILNYLESVKLKYELSSKDISNSLFEMKQYFPEASCLLMLFLLDEYCISHIGYSPLILQEIYNLLCALYDKADNCYRNLQILDPEIFTVCMLLGYEYIAFFKEFFSLDPNFDKYFQKLAEQVEDLSQNKVRQSYAKVISRFILKECRTLSRITQTQNVEKKLEQLKDRIDKLDNSFLEEVIAKMAMNCFVDYQQLNSMKNMLKVRIKNLTEEEVQPHLYKYYYDYLLKIGKIFKVLDEEISIYDAILYIIKHDPHDHKYQLQYHWIQFSKSVRTNDRETIVKSLKNIEQVVPQLTGQLKSEAIRKATVIKIYIEEETIADGLKLALGIDRCFENLQCIGFYYFIEKDYERALRFLKQAFILNQTHYHVNRVICICLIKQGNNKEVYSFLQRIYEGFSNSFWVNYMLGMHSIENRKLEAAEKYLTTAIEAFKSEINKTFKFSYEKTEQAKKYSLFYMIDQNEFTIFHDEFVLPEETIYAECPLTSSLLSQRQQYLTFVKLNTQIGEVLKVLGRTKSAYNYLADAYSMSSLLSAEEKNKNKTLLLLTKKQFGSILFYMGLYKEAENVLKHGNKECEELGNEKISRQLSGQIKSLLFEVSVERLSEMMKFQSYETIEDYILSIPQYKAQHPSLNYFKSKYQFHILSYLHNSSKGIQPSLLAIQQFLNFFKLKGQTTSVQFSNRILQLEEQEQILAKECLEDYYVLMYIEGNRTQQNKIKSSTILPLIQLFPRSTVFYIMYGMTVDDIKLKIASFLKCIQLDRQSPISVDLLASLYLKEKDYLTACKLFLKSLQIQLFNPKCYVGLCICLFSIMGRCYENPSVEQAKIIKECVNRINSYMQFLRYVDPSGNYQLLKFLKIVLSDEKTALTEIKATLEYGKKLKTHKYKQNILQKLMQKANDNFKELNMWKDEDQVKIVEKFIKKYEEQPTQEKKQICFSIANRIQDQLKLLHKSKENQSIKMKKTYLLQNKICIILQYALTFSYQPKLLQLFIDICSQIGNVQSAEITGLKSAIKQNMYNYAIHGGYDDKTINRIENKVFGQIETYDYLLKNIDKISNVEKVIKRKILLNPSHMTLRKAMMIYLVGEKNLSLKKMKLNSYKVQLVNDMNSDEMANQVLLQYKKLILLHNDHNSWLGYISQQWNDSRLRTKENLINWVKVLNKISDQIQEKEKGRRLLIQILAYAEAKYNLALENVVLNEQDKRMLCMLKQINKLQDGEKQINLKVMLKQQISQSSKDWVLMHLITYLAHNYEPSSELSNIADMCYQTISKDSKASGYCQLIRFLVYFGKKISTEDELIDTLKQLMMIVNDCEQRGNIHPNCIVFMKCMISMLNFNNEELEAELAMATNNRFVTYSDQLIINYFEIIKEYRDLQQNPATEGAYENFTLFIDQVIGFAREPIYKGFFLSLKAMAQGIVSAEDKLKLGRWLKQSLLLSPQSGKKIIN